MDGDLLNIKRIKCVNVSFIFKIRTEALITQQVSRRLALHNSESRPLVKKGKCLTRFLIINMNVRVGKIRYDIQNILTVV